MVLSETRGETRTRQVSSWRDLSSVSGCQRCVETAVRCRAGIFVAAGARRVPGRGQMMTYINHYYIKYPNSKPSKIEFFWTDWEFLEGVFDLLLQFTCSTELSCDLIYDDAVIT